ncbi:2',3'-cyclic-nucleotide 2'-phosphodiesterase/5'-or 3'-nucleotidase, 5'-nucleotidase family [Halorientalis persicus]|uniref:2',3'-cyclic-nucleotide 2'-phosphodiesterase/5'-or 3'-nucleotidase, 5'-nucleotidase family n=1 Tax=Halorientalis persicus TaxID=1367881 RepID=A0A1H8JNK5_9EURY|nr:bifunctional metallophosphatase/5'-nucleotidase [Halorientalis persicus]SEN82249.1 2',3'-cyclic-nucleotide 2'-phosphodiesterase/5'-or 3'-nucleotidase, 5'-nucleotidase family [Halorientalis persicus]
MPPRLLHYSDVENAYDDPSRIGRLAGLVRSLRADDTLVLGTGDNTAPGVLSMVSTGRQALDFFGAVAPDADTFGNHDFDYGPDAITEIVRESPQTWVSANVEWADDGPEGAESAGERFGHEAGVVPSTVVAVDGSTVGLTGVTEPKTGSMCPGATGLTFTDPVAAVRRETARLREREVDAVVVLSHLGSGDDELARETDVNVILGGHVHSSRSDRVADTLLTRPGANARGLLEIDLELAPSTDAVTVHEVGDGPLDESVADAMRTRRSAAGLDAVVGHVDDPITRDRAVKHTGECRIGNFIADAYRWAADADVGLQNSGGIREGPPLAGEVTVADLVSVVPFDEPVTVAELTGRELRQLCREADGEHVQAVADRWHAHVSSGLTIERNGSGVEAVRLDGAPLSDDVTYTLATTDYLFHTDHEFPVLDEHHRVERLSTQYEVLATYAREQGIDPAVEDRIRHVSE